MTVDLDVDPLIRIEIRGHVLQCDVRTVYHLEQPVAGIVRAPGHTSYGIEIFVILILHVLRDKPVWQLIAAIDIAGGSTGYHRFMLIDQAVKRFGQWFLLGEMHPELWGWGLQDLTNMYIFEAVFGGVIPVVFFVLIIIHSFKAVYINEY